MRSIAFALGVWAFLALVSATAGAGAAGWSAFKGLPVSSLEFTGLDREMRDALKPGLALAGRRRLFGRERPLFFAEILEEDLSRARLFLARRGYPHAAVKPEIAFTESQRSVRVTLEIASGPAVRIREVRLPEFPEFVDSSPLPLRSGDRFTDDAVLGAAQELESRLRVSGHAFAKVESRLEPVDSIRVDIALEVNTGPRYRIGEVRVDGASSDLESLVRSAADFDPGEHFDPKKLRRAEASLRELDLFRVVRLGVEPLEADRLLVHCALSERPARSLAAGVGYYSDEQLRLDLEWRHRNAFGGGRGIRIGGRLSRFLQTVRGDLVWPRVAGTPTRGVLGTAVRRENEEAYELIDTRIDLTARRPVGRRSWLAAGVALSYLFVDVRTRDLEALDDPEGIVTSVPISWTRDTSNHPVYPERGMLTRVQGELTPPGLGSAVHYARAEIQVSAYRGFRGSVLAGRVLLGGARPLPGSDDVLASKRLFSGGSRSMRGFGRRRLGPQDSVGDPLGGEAKLEASGECRFPLVWRFEGAAFLDVGQVWSDQSSLTLASLEWAAGPALMVRTPIGPVRLDWGILLEPEKGEPRSVLHFSVGHPY